MSSVFISYRRDDTRWVARALKNKLANAIGEERVFMDIDSIDPGVDFVDVLEQTVSQVDALIAVIGPDFLTIKDDKGNRRIDDPNDLVRLEIAAALKRDIRVIPLVQAGTPVPTEDDLPDDLKPLARRNAVEVGESSFESDIDRIVNSLERLWAARESDEPEDTKRGFTPASVPKKDSADSSAVTKKGWFVPLSVGVAVLAIVGLIFAFSGIWSPDVASKPDATPAAATDTGPATETAVVDAPPSTDTQPVDGMVWIPSGKFPMGSPADEEGRRNDEKLHEVEISEGFYLGKFEITQEQFELVMGENPSAFKQPDAPVENVSWDDAVEFCARLNDMEEIPAGLGIGKLPAGFTSTLPTEAQWEFACRAGTTERLEERELYKLAVCYEKNMEGRTSPAPVRSKEPNAWGLYDMLGNVEEWCLDVYGAYKDGPVTDPVDKSAGDLHVKRGGSYFHSNVGDEHNCRAAARAKDEGFSQTCGFRVAGVKKK